MPPVRARIAQVASAAHHLPVQPYPLCRFGLCVWPMARHVSRRGPPISHFDDMDSVRSALEPEHLAQFKPQPILLKKGQVREKIIVDVLSSQSRPHLISWSTTQAAIHHPLLVHGSYANKSDQPRRATVVNVFADGTASLSDAPLLRDVPVVPPGQPLTVPTPLRLSSISHLGGGGECASPSLLCAGPVLPSPLRRLCTHRRPMNLKGFIDRDAFGVILVSGKL